MKGHIINQITCPYCSYKMDCASCPGDETITPHPNAASFCVNCGEVSLFDDNMQLRLLTREEESDLNRQLDVVIIKKAWREMKAMN